MLRRSNKLYQLMCKLSQHKPSQYVSDVLLGLQSIFELDSCQQLNIAADIISADCTHFMQFVCVWAQGFCSMQMMCCLLAGSVNVEVSRNPSFLPDHSLSQCGDLQEP